MSSQIGNRIKVQIFGQSHSEQLGVVIDGLPAGETIDMNEVLDCLKRRQGGNHVYSTSRKEADTPHVVCGLLNTEKETVKVTCGAPVCAFFENRNTRPEDYEKMTRIPRPSHADYTADIKYHGFEDRSGGGHFSGRMTLPICFAGAVAMQLLKRKGITIRAHILRIGDIADRAYDPLQIENNLNDFPTLDREAGERMQVLMTEVAARGDSVGGIVECGITGLEAGIGAPFFDTLESRLSYGLFAIPAVKGVSFGAGFDVAGMLGSKCNDIFYIANGNVATRTNNSGGIQGGISNGMPILFQTAFKPTPSIYLEQDSVDLNTMTEVKLRLEGRHDPCIVPRAVVCVEAMAAIVLVDELLA